MRTVQVQLALKARGLRDDITVIVVDALPDPGARLPPLLQRKSSGANGADAANAAVVIGRPLEQAGGTWRHAVWCARCLSGAHDWHFVGLRVQDHAESTIMACLQPHMVAVWRLLGQASCVRFHGVRC